MAYNGSEALKKIKNSYFNKKEPYHYALIFMDLAMPIMDGYYASDKIRSFFKSKNLSKVLKMMVSILITQANVKKAWRYQIDEVLNKSTNPDYYHKKLPYKFKIQI